MSILISTVAGSHDGPDAPPAYDGPDNEAHRYLIPGLYRATAEDGIEIGWLFVYDSGAHYPSAGIQSPWITESGSFYLADNVCMMGCPHTAPHNHTLAGITGEWW